MEYIRQTVKSFKSASLNFVMATVCVAKDGYQIGYVTPHFQFTVCNCSPMISDKQYLAPLLLG